ncbi:unnamed protein product [Amaranthus hypochondriacus]
MKKTLFITIPKTLTYELEQQPKISGEELLAVEVGVENVEIMAMGSVGMHVNDNRDLDPRNVGLVCNDGSSQSLIKGSVNDDNNVSVGVVGINEQCENQCDNSLEPSSFIFHAGVGDSTSARKCI